MDVVRELLSSGLCNLNIKDRSSRTPLHLASKQGYFMIIKELLTFQTDHGNKDAEINPNARDHTGDTPLHYVVSREGEPELPNSVSDFMYLDDFDSWRFTKVPKVIVKLFLKYFLWSGSFFVAQLNCYLKN